MATICIVDDEPAILNLLGALCRKLGHDVHTFSSARDGLPAIEARQPDLLIVDLMIGDANGLDVLQQTRKISPKTIVIMVTGYGTVDTAVEAMRLGAFDYVAKPFELQDIEATVRRALEGGDRKAAAVSGDVVISVTPLLGNSAPLQRIREQIQALSVSPGPVLVSGEFGVGKQTIARAIHRAGKRRTRPFRLLQCGALPEELLERELFDRTSGNNLFARAQGGTVFIEEIHALPMRLQAQLNVFLEEITSMRLERSLTPEMDFLLICSSTEPLEELVAAGKFRQDLFYRLTAIHLAVPPLRKRREDIEELTVFFLKQIADGAGIRPKKPSKFAMEFLGRYSWPGNLDELRYSLEHACALHAGDEIEPDHLPTRVSGAMEIGSGGGEGMVQKLPIGETLASFTRRQEQLFILETIKFAGGSKEKAASILDISIATLYRKLDHREE